MIVGVVTETYPGERRVALVPQAVQTLLKKKLEVVVQASAGVAAGYPDAAYKDAGARLLQSRAEVLAAADVLVQVRAFGANPEAGAADLSALSQKHTVIGFCDPLGSPRHAERFAKTGATLLSMELMPRITRAQSMDALSSMANLAGYKAVLLAAVQSPRLFPMMMTAAGTITPARVLVLGAGVAGLQAIATAKRLGAVVEAYDVRPEVKEQVQSVGGKFIDLGLEQKDASDKGGYAKALTPEQLLEQQQKLATFVRNADVVITTAQVPGRRAPTLLTAAMMKGAKPGAVVVDLAAEQGGNCELTRAGETYEHEGVTFMGPVNVPASLPFHASQLYAKNVATFLAHLVGQEGSVILTDEIAKETLVTRGGEVVHARVRAALAAPQEKAS